LARREADASNEHTMILITCCVWQSCCPGAGWAELAMKPRTAIPQSRIAHGRSGDKGNHANVAIIAYTPAGYAWLRDHLTAALVQSYFAPLGASQVVRYEAPNLLAVNFVLYNVLAGGASGSLRVDTQGKT